LIEQKNGDAQNVKNMFVFSLQSIAADKEKDEDVGTDERQRRIW